MVAPYCPEQGDFIWIHFEPQSGREITKYRPAIVLSPHHYNREQGLCIVCPITSKRKGHYCEIEVTIQGKTSMVKADRVASMDWRTRRAKFISHAPEDVMEEIRETIAALLGIA